MQHSLLVRKTVLILLACPFLCSAQGTFQITFDGPPLQPPNSAYLVQDYFEAGMWFRPIGTVGFVRHGGESPLSPHNGTAYLQAGLGSDLAFGVQNSTQFGVISIDLAGYSTVVPDFAVNFVGHRSDGSTISTSFSGSGITFQTYHFDSAWSSGLTRVEIPNYAWSLDNLVVIPEPGTGALLVIGGLALALWTMKRRNV